MTLCPAPPTISPLPSHAVCLFLLLKPTNTKKAIKQCQGSSSSNNVYFQNIHLFEDIQENTFKLSRKHRQLFKQAFKLCKIVIHVADTTGPVHMKSLRTLSFYIYSYGQSVSAKLLLLIHLSQQTSHCVVIPMYLKLNT